MAYNPLYQYGFGYPYQQPIQQQPVQQQQATGFISVRSIDEALAWPIAPGNSLTFKDESAPYIYTKTKGFSQLEQPVFEKFRLVREESAPEPPTSPQEAFDAKAQIETLWQEVNGLKTALDGLRSKGAKKPVIRKDADDEQQSAE